MSQTTTDRTDGQAPAPTPTESELYRLLADEQRRAALLVLADQTAPVALDDLAAAVAARVGDLDTGAARQASVRLHHCHLPKLDDAGLVEYDPDSHRVESVRVSPSLLP